MAKWKYEIKPTNTKSKEAPIDDFFTRSSEANSLIREAIQNSLDEQINSEKPVIVKITINNKAAKLPSEQVLKWFAPEGIDHFESDSSGLRNKPDFKEDCSYLIYEDFNTHGLTGNVWQHTKIKDKPNSFYGFYRQEGQTEKLKGLGSNGVGKIVFPMSSKVRTMFGFTTRNDDKKTYLMGVSSLSNHNIDDDIYLGDGYYANFFDPDDKSSDFEVPAEVSPKDYNGFALPIDETEIIEEFRKTFKLKREIGEFGLSVIVPWLVPKVGYGDLLKSIIEEYYPAIMSGALVVEMNDNDNKPQHIDKESIYDLAFANNDISENIRSKIDLALEYYTAPGLNNNDGKDTSICLSKTSKTLHEWSDKSFPEGSVSKIREDLEPHDHAVMIKVPVTIHYNKDSGKNPESSFFTVVLKKFNESLKPTFVRDQLIISDAARYKIAGYLAMVFIQDGPLLNFTRDAENPAHVSWSHRSKNFMGKYVRGEELLTYVRTAPRRIVRRLASEDEKPDSTVLADTFFINRQGAESAKNKKTRKKKIVVPKNPRVFRESKLQDGFKISGTEHLTSKREFTVQVGYEIARGNAIKKWIEEDFKLEDMDIVKENITNLSVNGNRIIFKAHSKNFSVNVSGFDKNRDLKVKTESVAVKTEDA